MGLHPNLCERREVCYLTFYLGGRLEDGTYTQPLWWSTIWPLCFYQIAKSNRNHTAIPSIFVLWLRRGFAATKSTNRRICQFPNKNSGERPRQSFNFQKSNIKD